MSDTGLNEYQVLLDQVIAARLTRCDSWGRPEGFPLLVSAGHGGRLEWKPVYAAQPYDPEMESKPGFVPAPGFRAFDVRCVFTGPPPGGTIPVFAEGDRLALEAWGDTEPANLITPWDYCLLPLLEDPKLTADGELVVLTGRAEMGSMWGAGPYGITTDELAQVTGFPDPVGRGTVMARLLTSVRPPGGVTAAGSPSPGP